MSSNLRAGSGYDVHPLTPDRPLTLGGVTIPFEKGLSGWSDGDVLTHAVIDALLGAAALGDIGGHFPTGNPKYRDISSLTLLRRIGAELLSSGWQIINIDATVLAEQPKLESYFQKMCERLSQALDIEFTRVNIKAKTSDGMGLIGRGEGIATLVTVLIERT